MKYYLGYYDNTEFKPIELEATEPTILSVVKFTTNFDNLNSLKQYLCQENKIPNLGVTLNYLIEKGKKGQKYYEPLKSSKIYTLEYASIFTVEGLKNFINKNKYDEEMIILLFSEYLRKYGFSKIIMEYLQSRNMSQLIIILKDLSKILSSNLKSQIDYLIANYETLTHDEILSHIDGITKYIINSNGDLVNTYLRLRSQINFKNIPTIKYLNNWFSITHDYNQTGNEYYANIPSEYRDINTEVNSFFYSIIYDYDSTQRDYKKINGKKKIQERGVFDLGVILNDYYKRLYDEYLSTIYEDDDTYDEDAEFLCESDFERLGTTSEESGIKIRKIYR